MAPDPVKTNTSSLAGAFAAAKAEDVGASLSGTGVEDEQLAEVGAAAVGEVQMGAVDDVTVAVLEDAADMAGTRVVVDSVGRCGAETAGAAVKTNTSSAARASARPGVADHDDLSAVPT